MRGLATTHASAFVVLLFAPWALSMGALSELTRGQLQNAVGPRSTVAAVNLAWSEGVSLDRLLLAGEDLGVRAVIHEGKLERAIVPAALDAYGANPIALDLALGPGSVTLDMGKLTGDDGETPEATPAPTPTPEAGAEEDPALPSELRPRLAIRDLDLRMVWPESDPRLTFRSLDVNGRAHVSPRLGVTLPEPLLLELERFVLGFGRGKEHHTPLVIEDAKIRLRVLDVPEDGSDAPFRLEADLEIARLISDELTLTDAAATLTIVGSVIALDLRGTLPLAGGGLQSSLQLSLEFDLTDAQRWPLKVDLHLEAAPFKGRVAQLVPYLLPLLQSVEGRRPTFPPVSLETKGEVTFVFDAQDELDGDATLQSIAAEGALAVAPGSLASSALLDGYARALLGIGVSGLLEGVLPPTFRFEGFRAPFRVAEGNVHLPELTIRSEAVDLLLQAEVALSGSYSTQVRAQPPASLPEDLRAILQLVDGAGGVRISGDLEAGTIAAVPPSLEALARAAQEQGTVEVLLRRTGLLEPGALERALRGGR